MATIGSIASSAGQSAQAVQAAQANVAAATDQGKSPPACLPPVNLARAASTNAVNAELVSSQWGVDPATVGGVYGGAGADGGLFAGDTLLPLLMALTHANAEQALALIGARTPGAAGATSPAPAAGGAGSTSTAGQSAQAQAASAPSGPMVVDPLWGRSA